MTQTIQLQFDGNYHIPFSNFLGIVPTDVDRITVTITTDPALNDAATFSINTIGSGPPDGPIATEATTFSTVKTLFR